MNPNIYYCPKMSAFLYRDDDYCAVITLYLRKENRISGGHNAVVYQVRELDGAVFRMPNARWANSGFPLSVFVDAPLGIQDAFHAYYQRHADLLEPTIDRAIKNIQKKRKAAHQS